MDFGSKLATYCDIKLELKNAYLNDEYYYYSLPFCVIDAIFSINVNYIATRNTVLRYADKYNLTKFREIGAPYPAKKEQHTISQFLENFDVYGNPERMAIEVFKNRQRTSPVNGILKSEAVYKWAKILQSYNIETFQDIENALDKEIEDRLKKVCGQSKGVSLDYLYMLTGCDNYCKPDRHIRNFIQLATEKSPSVDETRLIISDAVKKLRNTYPYMTDRLLDCVIWKYMSNKNN
jgi:hypothetical protein